MTNTMAMNPIIDITIIFIMIFEEKIIITIEIDAPKCLQSF